MVICCSGQSYVLVLLMDLTFGLNFPKIRVVCLSRALSAYCHYFVVEYQGTLT